MPAKRPSVRPKWCIAIKSLQQPQYSVQMQSFSRMIYWIIRLVKSRFRTRFMPIDWRLNTSQNNHNVPLGFRAILYLFSSKNGIFHKFLYRAFWYSRNYTYFYFPKWRYRPRMVLKIINLHILRYLPTCRLYLLECHAIDNQRCTHTASRNNSSNYTLFLPSCVYFFDNSILYPHTHIYAN